MNTFVRHCDQCLVELEALLNQNATNSSVASTILAQIAIRQFYDVWLLGDVKIVPFELR